MSSPILVNFGLGGSPTSLHAHRTWEKRKVGTATYTNLTWEKTLQRGSVGQSELGAAALHKAIWWDLHLCKPADTFVLLNCTLKLILLQQLMLLFMATLHSRYGHYIFAL